MDKADYSILFLATCMYYFENIYTYEKTIFSLQVIYNIRYIHNELKTSPVVQLSSLELNK